MRVEIVDLATIDGRGPAWGTASEELNATLLVLAPRRGPAGARQRGARRGTGRRSREPGCSCVGGEKHALTAGALAIVPRGASRSIVAGPEGLRCLTVHRRRGGLGVTDFREGGPEHDARRARQVSD